MQDGGKHGRLAAETAAHDSSDALSCQSHFARSRLDERRIPEANDLSNSPGLTRFLIEGSSQVRRRVKHELHVRPTEKKAAAECVQARNEEQASTIEVGQLRGFLFGPTHHHRSQRPVVSEALFVGEACSGRQGFDPYRCDLDVDGLATKAHLKIGPPGRTVLERCDLGSRSSEERANQRFADGAFPVS